jgi:hypothetical protein
MHRDRQREATLFYTVHTYIHNITPVSHWGRQSSLPSTCYDPYKNLSLLFFIVLYYVMMIQRDCLFGRGIFADACEQRSDIPRGFEADLATFGNTRLSVITAFQILIFCQMIPLIANV